MATDALVLNGNPCVLYSIPPSEGRAGEGRGGQGRAGEGRGGKGREGKGQDHGHQVLPRRSRLRQAVG